MYYLDDVKTLASGAIFLLVLLASCSSPNNRQAGTRLEEGRAASAGSSATQDHRPVIVAFGDSLTAGVVETTYPDVLQKLLDQNGFRYQVDNQGVAGDTSSDGLSRIDNVIAEHPALVLLEFGGNDGLRGIPVDVIKHNLDQMITELKAEGTRVALLGITLPPNFGVDYVKSFTAMYADLAKQQHIPVMPFLLVNVYRHKGWMQPDGIHPSSEGNKAVAEDVFHFIEPYLKK